MIAGERRKLLIQRAERLGSVLGQFKTPGSGEPVDPSRLAEVMRFVKVNGTADLGELLTRLPASYLRNASQSARPQLEEIQRRVTPIAREITDTDELTYLLGWARRLMSIAEKKGVAGVHPSSAGARGGERGGRR